MAGKVVVDGQLSNLWIPSSKRRVGGRNPVNRRSAVTWVAKPGRGTRSIRRMMIHQEILNLLCGAPIVQECHRKSQEHSLMGEKTMKHITYEKLVNVGRRVRP